jgi:hypothetical protein
MIQKLDVMPMIIWNVRKCYWLALYPSTLIPNIRMAFVAGVVLLAAPFKVIHAPIINNARLNFIHIIASHSGVLVFKRIKLMLELILGHIVASIGDSAWADGVRVDGENVELLVLQFVNTLLNCHGDAGFVIDFSDASDFSLF